VLEIDGRPRPVTLKLEGANPGGSSKDRTALSLIQDLEHRGLLDPDSVIVESTSGNLGVSLALISRAKGYKFHGVVDPKAPRETLERMRRFGAVIEMVTTQDPYGGYLLARLKRVAELCASSAKYRWSNQYSNTANPTAHARSTGPEIWHQMNGAVDAVFVAVSTGGTLAGIGQYFRATSRSTKVVGVDVVGSVAFGGSPGPRKLNGIGSARSSAFLTPALYDESILVSDAEAISFCRYLRDKTGLFIGGSSGAVVAACARYLATHVEIERAVCLSSDGGANYISSIFNDQWVAQSDLMVPHTPPLVQNAWRRELTAAG
jgi:2,3-diaminopropionate biosynthesis protein SbnA